MIKSLPISILALFVSGLSAQSFTVSQNPVLLETELDGNGGPFQFVLETVVSNSTDQVLELHWERITNDVPPCWATAIEDNFMHHFVPVNESEISVPPSEEFDLRAYFYPLWEGPEASAGNGHVVLQLTNLNDTTESVRVNFFITVSGDFSCMVSLSEDIPDLQIPFPNPTADRFQLPHSNDICELLIHDLRGKLVEAFNVNAGRVYDVSSLSPGLYTLRLLGREGQIIKSCKLLKQ